jgi:3-hexulose-6-phosphate synthase
MKLQVSFDSLELEKSLSIATQMQEYVDIFEIGSLLVYKYGITALEEFRKALPEKTLLADIKIADRGKEVTQLFAKAGADWITVLAGTNRNVIHTACTTANDLGKKVMLDLLDASSLGQSAVEAQTLGASALLFHRPATEHLQAISLDQWEMVKGNTKLPIFIATHVTRENIEQLIQLQPGGIVMGRSATESSLEEIQYLSSIIHSH